MPLHSHESGDKSRDLVSISPLFSNFGQCDEVPRFRLAAEGVPAATAYQVVHDELLLDGNARLNLATFVTTWMEREAETLMAECVAKNLIDKDEYPQSAELERRCVNILASLWNAAPASSTLAATGCSTIGSSEACMLAGLALQRRWRTRRHLSASAPERPNLVMGTNVQVCWEKFCRYWDVEPRLVPVGPDATHLTPEGAVAACDENTIGVVAVLGSTFDGAYEPVAEIAEALDRLAAGGGPDVPMHVDAASGGFIAPFLDPDLLWDFRVPRVQSINASGHKFGLVYPGVGWAVWRDVEALPEELIFRVDYLGGDMPTFALNFSRPAAQVAAQYFNFVRLGFEGYRQVQQASRDTAMWLASEVAALGPFALLSKGDGIPAFAFQLHPDCAYSVYDVSEFLRVRGWIVPAYKMPPALEDTDVLRVVVRNGLSRDLAAQFLSDLSRVVKRLEDPSRRIDENRTGFHH